MKKALIVLLLISNICFAIDAKEARRETRKVVSGIPEKLLKDALEEVQEAVSFGLCSTQTKPVTLDSELAALPKVKTKLEKLGYHIAYIDARFGGRYHSDDLSGANVLEISWCTE